MALSSCETSSCVLSPVVTQIGQGKKRQNNQFCSLFRSAWIPSTLSLNGLLDPVLILCSVHSDKCHVEALRYILLAFAESLLGEGEMSGFVLRILPSFAKC